MIKDNETKQLILDSALKIFSTYGYQASPMRKITGDIGFTPGALYGYFKSKEELFYALTDPTAKYIRDTLETVKTKIEEIPLEKRLELMPESPKDSLLKLRQRALQQDKWIAEKDW